MILQLLAQYYERLESDPEQDVAPFGFEKKEIDFIITLNEDGSLAGIQDTREYEGKKKKARSFMVPISVKRASSISANLLWDNLEYVFGTLSGNKEENERKKGGAKKVEKSRNRAKEEQFPEFFTRVETLAQKCDDRGLQAIMSFLCEQKEKAKNHLEWEEMKKGACNISFRLADENRLICEQPDVKKAINELQAEQSLAKIQTGLCLITGLKDNIKCLHAAIKGVKGASPMGANIVSFNLDAFCSYGKKQGFNAQVSEAAEFAYTTALNMLLGKESKQKIQVGDATTVFWAEKAHPLETGFAAIFDSSEDFNEASEYENQAVARYVKTLLRSPETGYLPGKEDDTRFYVLGLSPNQARIAVRFWYAGTVSEVEKRITDHFKDLEIVHGPRDKDFPSLNRLLKSLVFKGDIGKHLPPNLAGEWMRTILMGLPYPRTLLMTALRRNSAEQNVSCQRAAIIKGFLNRFNRFYKPDAKEVTMSLDTDNLNAGYRLGRLFAVLERVQEQANPGINATIRDRFYGTASTTPVATFPILIKLSKHHLSKLGKTNKGREINLEKLIGAILQDVNSLPAHLNLGDQGQFAIGYYHQRQDFFKKKETNNNKEEEKK